MGGLYLLQIDQDEPKEDNQRAAALTLVSQAIRSGASREEISDALEAAGIKPYESPGTPEQTRSRARWAERKRERKNENNG